MKKHLLILALSASALTACSGGKALNTEEPFNQNAADQNNQSGDPYNGDGSGYTRTDGFNAQDLQANAGYSDQAFSDPSSALAKRTLYFNFNSSEMDQGARDTAVAHAKFLAMRPAVGIVLEGHADERGTREYNIALGQSRAEVVKRIFLLHGVRPSQIRLISYGEEKPVVMGHSDDAWAKNRRVELRYKG